MLHLDCLFLQTLSYDVSSVDWKTLPKSDVYQKKLTAVFLPLEEESEEVLVKHPATEVTQTPTSEVDISVSVLIIPSVVWPILRFFLFQVLLRDIEALKSVNRQLRQDLAVQTQSRPKVDRPREATLVKETIYFRFLAPIFILVLGLWIGRMV